MKVRQLSIWTLGTLLLSMGSQAAMDHPGKLVGSLEGEAQVVQGQLNYQLPIELPGGPNDLAPALSIDYNPSNGNGLLGVGFQLSGLSAISRCPATQELDGFVGGVDYTANDRYCLGGQRLIAIRGKDGANGTEYRTETESYARIRSYGRTGNGPTYWRVWDKSGFIREYGNTTDSREQGRGRETIAWRLNQQKDRFNNAIDMRYAKDQGIVRPSSIDWSVYRLSFEYGSRPDVMQAYRFGRAYTQRHLLNGLSVQVSGQLRHRYQLRYEQTTDAALSRLAGISLCDAKGKCIPETTFQWRAESIAELPNIPDEEPVFHPLGWIDEGEIQSPGTLDLIPHRDYAGYAISDLNRDGQPDLCYLKNGLYCGLGAASRAQYSRWTSALDGNRWNSYARAATLQLVDLNNDLLPDACILDDQGLYCGLNQGGRRFGAFSYVSRAVTENDNLRYVDINADDWLDACTIGNGTLDCILNQQGRFGARQQITATVLTHKSGEKYNTTNTFIDINGDARTDLCGATSQGMQCHLQTGRQSNGLPQYGQTVNWHNQIGKNWQDKAVSASFRWTDVNADGLADVCYRQDKTYQCALNTGAGFTTPGTWATVDDRWGSDHDLAENTHLGSLMMPDLDQDGRADLCVIDSDYQLNCALNRNGYGRLETYARLDYIPDAVTLPNGDKSILLYHPLKASDINADGIPDTCYRSHEGLSCLLGADQHHALLTGVTSGYGNSAGFEYGWLTEAANHTPDTDTNLNDDLYPVNPALRVVTAVSASNGIGGQNRQTYHYVGMTWDKQSRRRVYRQTRETNQATGRTQITDYHLGGDLHGQVTRTSDALGEIVLSAMSQQTERLAALDARIKRYHTSTQSQQHYGLDGTLLSTIHTETRDLDAYGNAGTVVVTTQEANQKPHIKTTRTTYSNNTDAWLIGKPTQITATHQQGGQTIMRSTSFRYDNTTGALLEETLQPGDALQLSTRFTYNAKGNQVRTEVLDRQGNSRATTAEYDASGRHVIKQTNALGHTETLTYDALCGLPDQQTGPNGLSTSIRYDSLCRKVEQKRPDGTKTTWAYAWSPGYATGMDWQDHSVTRTTETTDGTAPAKVYNDALGREVRKLTYGDNNKPILQDTTYNARGLVEAATLPYYEGKFPGDATYWVTTEYDALGRTLAVHKPDQSGTPQTTRYQYQGHTITVTDPAGNSRSETKNALDQTVYISEPNGSWVRHSYDPIGNLTESNANGRKITNQYDAHGNKIRTNDPSMGNWQYAYNAYGELVRQTDAKGQTTTISYDKLGRMTERRSPNEQAAWEYDTAENGIGKLAVSRNQRTTRTHHYDSLGRPTRVTTEIDEQQFSSQIDYDALSRPVKDTRPDGVEVHRQYDAQGRLASIHLPKKHVWDYDYVQLEDALDAYAKGISELQDKIIQHEENYKKYLVQAERYRQHADYYQRVSQRQQNTANRLERTAQYLGQRAAAQQRQANHYRRLSQYYWNRFGHNYFSYVGSSNGYVRYRFTERTSCARSRKGSCQRWNYYHHNVSVRSNMVKNQCNWQRRGKRWMCYWGPPRRLHMGRFYGDWATRYQNYANSTKRHAQRYHQYADRYEASAKYYAQRAADMRKRAQDMYAMARQETDWLRVHSQKLDDYQAAADALQRQLDEHHNSDETVLVWAATSRDAAGRLKGELAGNGQLTRREYDPYSGRLMRIVTAVGDQQPIRDLRYTYDGADNVKTRHDLVNKTQHSYRYDAQDRLLEAAILSERGARTLRYRYDAHGNLLYKSGAGDMQYDAGNRLTQRMDGHGQITRYEYDANGNLVKDTQRTLSWTAYNKIERLVTPDSDASFYYDADRGQIKEERIGSDGKTTRYSLGQAFAFQIEDDLYGNQRHKYEHAILVEGHQVVLHIKTINNGKKEVDQTHYLHTDALNSIDTITNAQGQVIERLAFDPFGQRARPQGQAQDEQVDATPAHTDRGYTGHRHLDDLGLIHMNARLYDPTLGRFLSADIYIQAPNNSQSHNRYIYVLNNPLKYTDPSGHFWWFVVGAIISAVVAVVVDNPIVRMIAVIAAAAFTGGAALGIMGTTFAAATLPQLMLAGAAAGFVSGGLSTGTWDGAFKGAVWGAISAAVAFGVKSVFDPGLFRHVGHGFSQGVMSELRGGDFKSGFIGGFVGRAAGPQIQKWFPGISGSNIAMRTIFAGLAGGVIAEASGGSFANGARTMAFIHLFKELPSIYKKVVRYGLDAGPGGAAVEKGELQMPVQGANNIGMQGDTVDPNSLWGEGGYVSRIANQIPGINAVAGMHDVFQVSMGTSIWRDVLNVPGMFVAAAATYAGFLGQGLNSVSDYLYVPVQVNDERKKRYMWVPAGGY